MPITKGKLQQPWFCCLYGPPGVGKTSLAANAPDPAVFLDLEDGTAHLDVARLLPEAGIRPALKELLDADCKTLIIDSLTSLERAHVSEFCKEKGWANLETLDYGRSRKQWRQAFLDLLQAIVSKFRAKGVNVLLIAHSKNREITDPVSQQTYDRFEIEVDKEIGPQILSMLDGCFLLKHRVIVRDEKALGTGEREVYTSDKPQYVAKTRWAIEDPVEPAKLFTLLK